MVSTPLVTVTAVDPALAVEFLALTVYLVCPSAAVVSVATVTLLPATTSVFAAATFVFVAFNWLMFTASVSATPAAIFCNLLPPNPIPSAVLVICTLFPVTPNVTAVKVGVVLNPTLTFLSPVVASTTVCISTLSLEDVTL